MKKKIENTRGREGILPCQNAEPNSRSEGTLPCQNAEPNSKIDNKVKKRNIFPKMQLAIVPALQSKSCPLGVFKVG